MKLKLIESDIPSKITFYGKKLAFYSNGVYHKTQISNPQHIVVVDENENVVSSSSANLTPDSVISDNDILSIVELYNSSGNLPDFYLYEHKV